MGQAITQPSPNTVQANVQTTPYNSQGQYQSTPQSHPSAEASKGRNGPTPQTRISRTGKVQELVTVRPCKQPDAIRGMMNHEWFTIESILDKPNIARQELALSMQRSTPKYRVKKAPKPNQAETGAVGSASC